MADTPHRVGSASDATSIASGATQYFQVTAIAGAKVKGRFLIHALGTASNDVKATCRIARGYGASNGSSLTPVVTETEDAAVTVPISARDWTATEPATGTAVIADKWKTFTQGQWLSDEHTIRDSQTLTLCVKNEAAGAITFYPEWKGV